MSIKIDNKTYLNLPEQVEKNRVDIENLSGQGGYYTQEEADEKFETKVDHTASVGSLQGTIGLVNEDLQNTKKKVTKNTEDITSINTNLDNVNTNIDKVNTTIDALNTAVGNISTQGEQNSTDISNLGSAVNALRTTTLALNSSKQDKLKAGTNITISDDNTISAQVDNIDLKPLDVFNVTADSDTVVRDVVDDKVQFHIANTINNTINNKLDKPKGIDDTELIGYNTAQVNIKIGDNLKLENNTLSAVVPTSDSYTKAESDDKYETKTNHQSDIDNINKVIPTDITVKDGKLGLEHDTTWLTNQNAINLGSNLTYDATTNTLNATGGGTVDAYTKAESDEKYQPKGTYVVPSDLEAYEKKSELTTTLSNYVTTTSLTTTLGDYVTDNTLTTTLDGYVTSSTLTNYSTTKQNDAKYQPIGSYETTADASTAHTELSGRIDTNTSDITKLRTDVDTMSTNLGTETILRRW